MISPVLAIMGGLFVLALLIGWTLRPLGGEERQDTTRDYERRRLYFAAVVLIGLGFIFVIAMSMYYFAPYDQREVGKEIFTTCVTVIPPVITLVLGYYFGKADAQRKPNLRVQGAEDNKQPTGAIDVPQNSA